MPNPKTGTVTTDVGKAVAEFKGGRVEYRTERQGGNVHVPLGKASFSVEDLTANFRAVVDELNRVKPASAKGRYIKRISRGLDHGPRRQGRSQPPQARAGLAGRRYLATLAATTEICSPQTAGIRSPAEANSELQHYGVCLREPRAPLLRPDGRTDGQPEAGEGRRGRRGA